MSDENEAEVVPEESITTNSDFTIQDEETRSFAQKIIDKFKALIQEIKSEFDKIIEESKHPAPNSPKQHSDNLSSASGGELRDLADKAKEVGDALEEGDALQGEMENISQKQADIDNQPKKDDDRPSTEGPEPDGNNNEENNDNLPNHVKDLRQGQNPKLMEGAGKDGSSQPANRTAPNSDVIARYNGGVRE